VMLCLPSSRHPIGKGRDGAGGGVPEKEQAAQLPRLQINLALVIS